MKLAVLFCLISATVLGQSRFYESNKRILDTVKADIASICKQPFSYRSITDRELKKRAKADQKVIAFLNDFYNKDLSAEAIRKFIIRRERNRNWGFDTIPLGGMVKYIGNIYRGGNLQGKISFATFNGEIVYKAIRMETVTNTGCQEPPEPMAVAVPDVLYLEKYCLAQLDFPVWLCWSCEAIKSDTVILEKLRKQDQQQYKLLLSDNDQRLNKMSWYDIDTYHTGYVQPDLGQIVKDNDTTVLQQLLYSPNHVLALYTMEALVFLNETGKMTLSPELATKMVEVRKADISIRVQDSDVVYSESSYKNSGATIYRIVSKYNRFLQRK